MVTILRAIQIVFSRKIYVLLGIGSALFFCSFFIFGTGMVTFYSTGPYIEHNLIRIGALVVLVALSGLTTPMLVYRIRATKSMHKEGATGASGILIGMATMSCCAPFLLPALLSFIGFSGTQLFYLNSFARQYSLLLSLISVGLLAVSFIMVSKSITSTCAVTRAPHVGKKTLKIN